MQLVGKLDSPSTAFDMEINSQKTKIMTNYKTGFQQQVKIGGATLEQVHQFKYLGAVVSDKAQGLKCVPEMPQAASTITKLKPLWRSKISMKNKVRFLRALIQSILMYSCETWTIKPEIQNKIDAMEMRCYRRKLGISYKE